MAVLATLIQEDSPHTQPIVAAAGISESKVQELSTLQYQHDSYRQALSISSWGVFSDGERLVEKLKNTDLLIFKQHRKIATKALPNKTHPHIW